MRAVAGSGPYHGRDKSPGFARMVDEIASVVRGQIAGYLGRCRRMELECQRTFAGEASGYLRA